MNSDDLKNLQRPLKEQYRSEPTAALVTLRAQGALGEGVTCSVETGRALVRAGLHPATGGTGMDICSGDLLLQALVACAGTTMNAVATSLGIALRDAKVIAEGDVDFRGTLGVDREAPVGFASIRLRFELDTDAEPAMIDKLVSLTERYCIVFQTLNRRPELSVAGVRTAGAV